ncbi:hypothetical protein [Lonepinella sp. BR2930]|uniref:hypothetical protein n=1 Tax=Lonepinella sp. BR2930 TaxID=3434554 RepID=UPI003F6DABCA
MNENYNILSDIEFRDRYGQRSYLIQDISNDFIRALIRNRATFSVRSPNLTDDARKIEQLIEEQGYSCRIYTENRSAAMTGSLFSGIASVVGVASAIGIAAHNLATYDPDFEIGKNLIDKKINVTYKK